MAYELMFCLFWMLKNSNKTYEVRAKLTGGNIWRYDCPIRVKLAAQERKKESTRFSLWKKGPRWAYHEMPFSLGRWFFPLAFGMHRHEAIKKKIPRRNFFDIPCGEVGTLKFPHPMNVKIAQSPEASNGHAPVNHTGSTHMLTLNGKKKNGGPKSTGKTISYPTKCFLERITS